MSEAANARLAEALRAESLGQLAEAAAMGAYSDYRSSVGSPKKVLIDLLRSYGREKLAKRVLAGDFDR